MRLSQIVFGFFFTLLIFGAFLRLNFLNESLIFQHSWGEAQYAMWAEGYKKALIWGIPNEYSGFSNYIPWASLIGAAANSFCDSCSIVSLGRGLSFIFSSLGLFFLWRNLRLFDVNKLNSLATIAIIQILPIFFRYSMTFYNEPLSFLVLSVCIYLLSKSLIFSEKLSLVDLSLLFFSSLFLGSLKLPNLAAPLAAVFLVWIFKPKNSAIRNATLTILASFITNCVFIVVQRTLFPTATKLGSDRWIFNTDKFAEHFNVFWTRLMPEEFGVLRWFWLTIPIFMFFFAYSRRCKFRVFAIFSSVIALASFSVGLLFLPGTIVHAYYLLPAVVGITLILGVVNQTFSKNGLCASVVMGGVFYTLLGPAQYKLVPVYPAILPNAMRFSAQLLQQHLDDECILSVGEALPPHLYYLGSNYTRCKASNREVISLSKDFSGILIFDESTNLSMKEEMRKRSCNSFDFFPYAIYRCHPL